MEDRVVARILEFCDKVRPGVDSVQAMAVGLDGLVKDVAEWHLGWSGREEAWTAVEAVADLLEWVAARPAASYRLSALRRTGERCGSDDVWEQVASASVPVAGPQQIICAAIRRRESERSERDRQG